MAEVKKSCPIGCSAYGILCDGNPDTSECSLWYDENSTKVIYRGTFEDAIKEKHQLYLDYYGNQPIEKVLSIDGRGIISVLYDGRVWTTNELFIDKEVNV